MNDKDFSRLSKSIVQAGKIRRGTMRPSRATTFNPADVRNVRKKLGKSQSEFALIIGVASRPSKTGNKDAANRKGPLGPC